jgi:hypothetical protein
MAAADYRSLALPGGTSSHLLARLPSPAAPVHGPSGSSPLCVTAAKPSPPPGGGRLPARSSCQAASEPCPSGCHPHVRGNLQPRPLPGSSSSSLSAHPPCPGARPERAPPPRVWQPPTSTTHCLEAPVAHQAARRRALPPLSAARREEATLCVWQTQPTALQSQPELDPLSRRPYHGCPAPRAPALGRAACCRALIQRPRPPNQASIWLLPRPHRPYCTPSGSQPSCVAAAEPKTAWRFQLPPTSIKASCSCLALITQQRTLPGVAQWAVAVCSCLPPGGLRLMLGLGARHQCSCSRRAERRPSLQRLSMCS